MLTSVFLRVCYRSACLGKCTDIAGLWHPTVTEEEKESRCAEDTSKDRNKMLVAFEHQKNLF